MQIKSDHLIRQIVKIQSLELLFVRFFFKYRIALFIERSEYTVRRSVGYGEGSHTMAITRYAAWLGTWMSAAAVSAIGA
jgi:hypothetical protein